MLVYISMHNLPVHMYIQLRWHDDGLKDMS